MSQSMAEVGHENSRYNADLIDPSRKRRMAKQNNDGPAGKKTLTKGSRLEIGLAKLTHCSTRSLSSSSTYLLHSCNGQIWYFHYYFTSNLPKGIDYDPLMVRSVDKHWLIPGV